MYPKSPTHPAVAYYFDALPHFALYYVVAILLAAAFVVAYVAITPHKEIALIRAGNSAAATQLVGAFLGFAIPLSTVISHSLGITDMVLWALTALIVQIATFWILAKVFPGIEKRIEESCMASGVFIGGVSLAAGIIQAGCMVP